MKYYMTTNNKHNGWMNPASLLDSFFGDSFGSGYYTTANKAMATDIVEHDDRYDMIVELAGYNKKDISLDYQDGYLTISATREHADHKYLRRESSSNITRRYYVGDVEQSQIKAQYSNGMLTVSIPKAEPVKANTTIAID